MEHREIECVERNGVFEPISGQPERTRRGWRHELLWIAITALAGLHLLIYDISTGRIANPVTLFGWQ